MSENSLSASRVIDAPADAIFDVLSLPSRHRQIDGSGTVVSGDDQRIQKVGQVFVMNMNGEHMGGDYVMENTVSGYDENKLLAWKTAPAGEEPPGWEWVWRFEATGPGSTDVSVTYDWSAVTDKELLKTIGFPAVSQDALEGTLANLAAQVSEA